MAVNKLARTWLLAIELNIVLLQAFELIFFVKHSGRAHVTGISGKVNAIEVVV